MKKSSISSLNQHHVQQNSSSNDTFKKFPLPKSSSSKCKKSFSNSDKSGAPELFTWDREKPRHNSEYIHKDFSKPFNNFSQHLNIIGGLGPIKCLSKKKQPKLVNRPTQVEKISHTTTKVLPNFGYTEQLNPIVCEKKKHLRIHEHVEKVRIAENLPIKDDSFSQHDTNHRMKSFNHENPFNLDLNALSEYQKQKSNAEDIQRRRNYQIIRRIMETKELKTEGAERIKQEERDAKFCLPAFFKISHEDDEQCNETIAEDSGDIDIFFLIFYINEISYGCGLGFVWLSLP